MKIVILDKRVRQNIERFRQLIHRAGQEGERVFQEANKGYKAYINCKTGEIRFLDLKEEDYPSTKWKAIVIQLYPTEEGAFEVVASEGKNTFDCSELVPDAYALFAKTIHTLNQLAYDPKHVRDSFWILRQLAILDFVISEREEGESNLIHDAWHNVDRLEAENLLREMKVGTYLFRKDEFAKDLEDNLNESLSSPVTCITLTYSEREGKIAEKTMVYQDGRWLFYNDDPALAGPGYENVKELLATMGKKLKEPLFVDEA